MFEQWRCVAMVTTVLILSGCLNPHRQMPEPRDRDLIFSAMDLPTPNRIRTADGRPGPEYWQQQVDYRIDAQLNEDTGIVTGSATVTYTNNSPQPLDYLWLHLEHNILKTDSLAMGLIPGDWRAALEEMIRQQGEGGIHIDDITISGRSVRLDVYDTVGRLQLPEPIPPSGGQLAFDIRWHCRIFMDNAFRHGAAQYAQGPVYEVAQWIPVMCVYDDVHGWNTLPYLGAGEFYTNFGTFDVRLEVPASHIVAATGVLQNPDETLTPIQQERLKQARQSSETMIIRSVEEVRSAVQGVTGFSTKTWHFVAHDVRTFAWASSPAFIWDAAGLPNRGLCPSEERGDVELPTGVLLQSFYPEEALPSWQRSTQWMSDAITHYGSQWAPYPYPVAINVAGPVGGMEYPMIIFCGIFEDEFDAWYVTVHEIGHTWFPMMVNTDERRHAWMDEGFNTFINVDLAQSAQLHELPIQDRLDESLLAWEYLDYLPAHTHPDHAPYVLARLNSYVKPAWALEALREVVLGHHRFDTAFREYIRAWSFRSPRPADFFRCMENAAGMDLAWFWRGWFYETGTLDQAVVRVHQPGRSGTVEVTFESRGELIMPVPYRVTYADGSAEDRTLPIEAWFHSNRKVAQWDAGDRRVIEILIDPDQILPDIRRGNNRWRSLW